MNKNKTIIVFFISLISSIYLYITIENSYHEYSTQFFLYALLAFTALLTIAGAIDIVKYFDESIKDSKQISQFGIAYSYIKISVSVVLILMGLYALVVAVTSDDSVPWGGVLMGVAALMGVGAKLMISARRYLSDTQEQDTQ